MTTETPRALHAGPYIQCATCHHQIRSMHRHDFVTCPCGDTFVDGGDAYLRVGGSPVLRQDNDDVFIETYNEEGHPLR